MKLVILYGGDLKYFFDNINSLVNISHCFSEVECYLIHWDDIYFENIQTVNEKIRFFQIPISSVKRNELIRELKNKETPEHSISTSIQSLIHESFTSILINYKIDINQHTIYCKNRSDLKIESHFKLSHIIEAGDAIYLGSKKFGIGVCDYILASQDPLALAKVLDFGELNKKLMDMGVYVPPEVTLALNINRLSYRCYSNEIFPSELITSNKNGEIILRTSIYSEKHSKSYSFFKDNIENIYLPFNNISNISSRYFSNIRVWIYRLIKLI